MSCSRCEIAFDANVRCPRVMSCGHVFCSSCLQGLQKHQPSDPTSPSPITTFTCPRDSVQVRVPSSCPEDAIRALPREREIIEMYEAAHVAPPRTRQCEVCDEDAHVATHRCVDCNQFFCSSVAKMHKKMKGFGAHIVEAIDDESSAMRSGVSQSNVCWDHNRLFEGYDTRCQRAVCALCFMNGTHKGHEIVGMEEAAELSRGQLPNSIAAGEALLRRLSSFRQRHSSVKQALRESYDKANAVIRSSFSKVPPSQPPNTHTHTHTYTHT